MSCSDKSIRLVPLPRFSKHGSTDKSGCSSAKYGYPPHGIRQHHGQVSDSGAIQEIAAQVIADNPENVEKFKGGKDNLIGWFVGQVMRESRGKADPNAAREVLEELLGE
jgi:Asp-tRNA(Asn)/Glu-tRNA(Gln) amidotransferase B subunit